jgi:multidrug efflux pump subunit AcrB
MKQGGFNLSRWALEHIPLTRYLIFNDEFGDTFGSIFALSGDGFSYAEVKDYADFVRQQLLQVPSVAKVELYGVQEEKINIEFSHKKFAQLGIPFDSIIGQLNAQNVVESSGSLEPVMNCFRGRAAPGTG